jgi:hypothetical protein
MTAAYNPCLQQDSILCVSATAVLSCFHCLIPDTFGLILQVKYFIKNLLAPIVNNAGTTAGNKELQIAYKELYEDCLDASNTRIGQYRKTNARKLLSAVESLGQSGVLKTLKKEDVDKIAKKFEDWWKKNIVGEIVPGKAKSIPLSHLCTQVEDSDSCTASGQEVCIPGQHLAHGFDYAAGERAFVKFVSCDPNLTIFKSAMVPKQLTMRGSDGKEYWWLVKGGEDVRQDERIQQAFRCMNKVLAADVRCAQRRLAIATYKVVPLSKLVGMIEFVRDTNTMDAIIQGNATTDEKKRRELVCEGLNREIPEYVTQISNAKKNEGRTLEAKFLQAQQRIPEDILRRGLMGKAQTAQV